MGISIFMLGLMSLPAFAFDSGSTGADGAFNPTTNTEVVLPADGIFNYTTVNIPTGVTVTFKKNAGNTPVYILATGNVTIAGSINVSGGAGNAIAPGKGGPGGFNGGLGGYANSCGGIALGFGGGKPANKVGVLTYGAGGGGGGFGAVGSSGSGLWPGNATGGSGGSAYGNANLLPTIGGSGGGGACATDSYIGGSGGGGGGAIVIATGGTINVTGSITANGGNGANYGGGNAGGGGGGSGGAIRLMANIIQGEGTISASGGTGGSCGWGQQYCNGGVGGAGRIRIEANTFSRTSNSSPSYNFGGSPLAVFHPIVPTLKIASVAGVAVFDIPTGAYSSPDVVLPNGTANPVDVVVEASYIPVGTTVTITGVPELGNSSSATAILAGTQASSSATAKLTISGQSANVLMATATFTFQTAANQMPVYADGEKVVKMRIASALGGASSVTYITETGKEIQANM